MTHWVYPVNDAGGSWSYPVSALELFTGSGIEGVHHWALSQRRHALAVDDVIWVRASKPLGAFIGVGEVVSPLVAAIADDGRRYWRFGVVWDREASLHMARAPVDVVMTSTAQSPRALRPEELGQLLEVRPAQRDRAAAEGGDQAKLHDELVLAYGGRCAVTGCDVPEALGARDGLLLRADVRALFDNGLLWVTASSRVALHETLRGGHYGQWHDVVLRPAASGGRHPDMALLAAHRKHVGR